MARGLRSWALAVALCAITTSCGGHDAAFGPPPPSLAASCGDTDGVHARPLWLHASDGQRLYAISGGSGHTGILLVPESPPGSVCGWLPYIKTLEDAPLRVLSIDYRGTGNSAVEPGRAAHAFGRDLSAAVDQLRADGATKIILLGASFGGAAAMRYGPTLPVDGVVSLSGETALPEYGVDAIRELPHLHLPLLIVGSRNDSYLSVGAARRLLRRAGTKDKQLKIFPGSWQGWEIVEEAPYASRARTTILDWIHSHD